MIRQSSSHGNLADENTMEFLFNTDRSQVKRTKSFWKFGKSDTEDIVEGMAMWRHRDLIQPEHEMRMEAEAAAAMEMQEQRAKEATLKRNMNNLKSKKEEQNKSKTMERNDKPRSGSKGRVKEMQQNISVPMIDDHAKYQLTKSEIDQRIGKAKERYYQDDMPRNGKMMVRDSETELGYAEDEDEMTIGENVEEKPINSNSAQKMRMNAYEVQQPNKLNNKIGNGQHQPQRSNKYYDDMMDMEEERFYDDESLAEEVMVMKTVKRKEILKQYYSSGTSDTEHHSSSSDPYDCIVVQDHHLMRNKNNVFNNNTNNSRKNNKNKEMTTFRSEFAMNKKNMDMEQQQPSTILPRTKLVKNDAVLDSSSHSAKKTIERKGAAEGEKKKPMNVDSKKNGNNKQKNFEESSRNSLSSAKSYGPWYDLWGANAANHGTNNNTLISQKQ